MGIPGWGTAAAYGAKLLSGAMDYFNGLAADRRKESDQNVGKKLQVAENTLATLKGDKDAQKTREDVADLTDSELDAELRSPGNSPAADKR